MNSIFNGDHQTGFPGILHYVRKYLAETPTSVKASERISQYLKLLQLRATGEIPTTAKWIRNKVQLHEDYEKNSIVTETISYDLLDSMRTATEEQLFPEIFKDTAYFASDFSKT